MRGKMVQPNRHSKNSRRRVRRSLPIEQELRDDADDNSIVRALLFRRRDILLIEFPDNEGRRQASVQIQHHNGSIELIYWDKDAAKGGGTGTVVSLFDTESFVTR